MPREVLGHIDCPTCGTKAGMRITHDKNGEPFGFSEACCNQQMRVGGDARRVAAFINRYPWAAGKPVTVTETVPAKADKAPAPPAAKAKASANPFDFLMGNK